MYTSACRLPNIIMRDYAPTTTRRWKLQLPGSYETYLSSMDRTKRYRHKYYAKRFEKECGPNIDYRVYAGVGDMNQFCVAAEQIASKTYQRGLGVGFLNNDDTYRRISAAADKDWLWAQVLYVQNEPIAFWQYKVYRNVLYCDTTGYNPAFGKYKVGTILLLKAIERCFELNVHVIDFGIGTAEYKERLSNEYLLECAVNFYAPSFRGIYANFIIALTNYANMALNIVLKRFGLLNRVKTEWRKHLQNNLLKKSDK